MRIWLDTTTKGKIIWGRESSRIKKTYLGRTEQIFPSLLQYLKLQKLTLKQVSGLGVVVGPGGFTAVRLAVIFANTLAYTLALPLYAFKVGEKIDFTQKKAEKQLTPLYLSAPNITKSR